MLPLEHVIGLSAILFVIGMIGVATRRVSTGRPSC